jgi:hypothetical protein
LSKTRAVSSKARVSSTFLISTWLRVFPGSGHESGFCFDPGQIVYVADVITKIVNGHPNSRIDELLPWAYPATPSLRDVA